MGTENRLPRSTVWLVVALCLLPTLARLLGLDLGSSPIDPEALEGAAGLGLVDQLHRQLAGSFVHTLFEWSAFLAALVTALLAFTHYSIEGDVATPILGSALLCAGALDAFHVLAADRLIAAVSDNRVFIPFTWGLSRIFNVVITLLGIALLRWRTRAEAPSAASRRSRSRPGFPWAASLGLGLFSWVVIVLCARSEGLPETLFPEAIVRRPYDLAALGLYLLAGLWLYPWVYRRFPSVFTHALVLSAVPDIATQLHMAFGSAALYDHHFHVAHGLKLVAYAVPLVGLMLDYSRTYRRADQARGDLERARDQLEVRVRERTTELATAKEAALAASGAKSDFLAHMSHELRTPLNSILGYSQILARDLSLGAKQRQGVAVIERSGEHLLGLIDEVLDLSKIEAGKLDLEPGEFSLPRLLEALTDSERLRAEQKGLSFDYRVEGTLPEWVCGDERRLRQILLNLVGNAIKFTEQGGVVLRVGRSESDAEGCWRIAVEDTGPGIPEERVAEIFEPFHQVDPRTAGEGTGLGLAITCRLVRLMGGEITVDSRVGEGSVFEVLLHLPESDGRDGALATAAARIVGYAGPRRTILVADDKEENRAILAGMLEPLGFEILQAADGVEALECIGQGPPDLVLMDLVMPRMDGFEATRRLRADPEHHGLTVIALSASVFDQDRRQSRTAGCDDFLPKPVRFADLLDRLAGHLGLEWVTTLETESEGPRGESAVGEDEGDAVVALPEAEVRELLDLARRGDVRGLSKGLESLASRLGPTSVVELRRLAASYDLEAIRERLERQLEESR